MSKRTAEQLRAYRLKNRERILTQEKLRCQNRTPEKRAIDNERKRKYRETHDPNYGIGRGHGRHARSLQLNMTQDERKAHLYALMHEWRMRNIEHVRAYRRAYEKKHREQRRRYDWLYVWNHYQAYLESHRRRSERKAIAEGREYKPRLSCRLPPWTKDPAHARHIKQLYAARKYSSTISFKMAIQSGLTVGRFSV